MIKLAFPKSITDTVKDEDEDEDETEDEAKPILSFGSLSRHSPTDPQPE